MTNDYDEPRDVDVCKRCGAVCETNIHGGLYDTHCVECASYLHLSEEVGITELTKHDHRFITPKLRAHLRSYSHRTGKQNMAPQQPHFSTAQPWSRLGTTFL